MVSRFSLQGISMITIPVFTRIMTTSEYGKFSNYNAWIMVLNILIGLQTHGSIANARVKYNRNDYKKYLSSVYSLSLLAYAFSFFIVLVLKDVLGFVFSVDSQLVPILLVNSFFSFSTTYYSEILIQDREVEKNAIISLLVSLSTSALSILFVQLMNTDRHIGRIYGEIIPITGVGVIEIVLIYRLGKTFINKEYWTYCLALTLPLILHGLSGLVLSLSDRIMLTKMIGDEATGIYGVAYGLAAIINTIWRAFNSSWTPFYYDYRKQEDFSKLKKKSDNYMLVFTVITCGFLLCAPEVYKIITPVSYWGGLKLLPLVALAYYFCFLYSFQANFEFYYEKTKLISIGTLLAASVNLLLNYLLIPRWTGVGAALATTVSYFFSFIFHYINAAYIIEEEYEHKLSFLLKGLFPVLLLSVLYYFTMDYWLVRWMAAGGLGVFLLHRFISRREII